MVLSSDVLGSQTHEYQFKNAIMTLASEAAILLPDNLQKAVEIFCEVLKEITRVKYYRCKLPRPTQPRVNKGPLNKWCMNKLKKAS
jgi:hypothetical protein